MSAQNKTDKSGSQKSGSGRAKPRRSEMELTLAKAVAALSEAKQPAEASAPSAAPAPQEPPVSAAGKILGDLKDAVLPVMPSLIMLLVGYWLVQSVELDMKKDRLDADTAQKMRDFIQILIEPEAPAIDQMRSTALVLGAFGGKAVFPLLSVLEAGSPDQVVAVQEGLVHAGLTDPDFTCAVLTDVIRDRTGVYGWRTHKMVIGVVGRIGCRQARGPLNRYVERAQGDLQAFNRTIEDTLPDRTALVSLEKTARQALERLAQK